MTITNVKETFVHTHAYALGFQRLNGHVFGLIRLSKKTLLKKEPTGRELKLGKSNQNVFKNRIRV